MCCRKQWRRRSPGGRPPRSSGSRIGACGDGGNGWDWKGIRGWWIGAKASPATGGGPWGRGEKDRGCSRGAHFGLKNGNFSRKHGGDNGTDRGYTGGGRAGPGRGRGPRG